MQYLNDLYYIKKISCPYYIVCYLSIGIKKKVKPNPRDMADETVLWSASKNYTNVLIGGIRNQKGDN